KIAIGVTSKSPSLKVSKDPNIISNIMLGITSKSSTSNIGKLDPSYKYSFSPIIRTKYLIFLLLSVLNESASTDSLRKFFFINPILLLAFINVNPSNSCEPNELIVLKFLIILIIGLLLSYVSTIKRAVSFNFLSRAEGFFFL